MIEFNGEKYYTQQEVAEMLHCSKTTIVNKISIGKIQGVRFGRLKYYTEAQAQDIRDINTYIHAKNNEKGSNNNGGKQ